MKKRLLSIITALALCLSLLPSTALAAESDGLCEHHTEHTAECGYVEGETPCGFVCDQCAGEDTVTVLTDWEWIDDWEIIDPDSGNVLLPFASEDNVAYFGDIVAMLPVSILADGEELTLGGWLCSDYPEEGAYEGEYIFETALPEGYALPNGGSTLTLTVALGDSEGEPAAMLAVTMETPTAKDYTIGGSTVYAYELSTAAHLYWFANQINTTQQDISAVLTADITVNQNVLNASGGLNSGSFEAWTPIGTVDHNFRGKFDGQGHTISGLYLNDSNASNVGLFGIAEGSIYRVGVVDSYFAGKENVGGLCGKALSNRIESCYTTATVSGTSNVGTFCGYSSANINNCYSVGRIDSSYGAFLGSGNDVDYCYALYNEDQDGAKDSDLKYRTMAAFQSGEVTYGLTKNQATPSWRQTIGTHTFPQCTTDGDIVYRGKNNGDVYYHNHTDGEASCSYCSAPTFYNNEYLIDTKEHLYWFADYVNSGHPAANANVRGDITVDNDWVPIGNETYAFTGRFAYPIGQKTISGIPAGSSLFGATGSGAEVARITVTSGSLCATSGGKIVDCHVSGGGMLVSGTNSGTVSDSSVASGGTLVQDNSGTVKNSSAPGGTLVQTNTGTITDCHDEGSGATLCANNNAGGTVTDCYVSGAASSVLVGANSGTIQKSYAAGGAKLCTTNNSGGKIINCYATGTGSVTLCGSNSGVIANCFASGGSGTTVGSGDTITNCYALAGDTASAVGGTTLTTTSPFASGEVAYRLDQGTETYPGGVWGQTINTDSLPIWGGKAVYYKQGGSPEYHNHDGYCSICTITPSYKDDQWQITNVDELYWYAQYINGKISGITGKTKNAILMNDITVNSNVLKADGTLSDACASFTAWTPIGESSSISYNNSTFDGNHHTISGLYVNAPETNYVGFFGFKSYGIIKNLTIADSYFAGNQSVGGICGQNLGEVSGCTYSGAVKGSSTYVGGICGYTSYGTVSDCTNNGTVSGSSSVGGICGYVNQTTVSNCTNSGTVTGTSSVGGICGNASSTTMSGCTNSGAVNGTSNYVGGVCGACDDASKVNGCTNTGAVTGSSTTNNVGGVCGNNSGTVSNCANTGNVTGYNYVGGVCGFNEGAVSGSTNSGAVESTNQCAGGICGEVSSGTVSGCTNSGTVNGGNCVGGVCGSNSKSGTVSNCANTAAVTGDNHVGGVCGSIYSSTVSGCTNSGTVNGGTNVGGVCGSNSGTASNCANTAAVNGTSYSVGGVCGNNYGTVSGCYSIGAVTGSSCVGGVCGYNDNNGSVENCYYNSEAHSGGTAIGDNYGTTQNVAGKDTKTFAGGEVAYLLNGSRSAGTEENPLVWYQNIDSGTPDAAPQFTGGTVYATDPNSPCQGYTNNSDGIKQHNYENYVCTWCGHQNTIPVTVSGIIAVNKVYDGTTAAALDFSRVTLNGVEAGDNVAVTATGTFADANADENKTVNITDLTLEGADAYKYRLADSGQQTSAAASITKKSVTAAVTVTSKAYDGTQTATVSAQVTATEGLISGDTITITGLTGTFDDANVGTKTVTINADGKSITGDGSGNYDVTIPPTATGTINKATNTWTTTPAVTNWTYGTPIAPDGEAQFGTVTVEYRLASGTDADYSVAVPTDAGRYTVRFTVAETANYTGLTETKDLTIGKKTIGIDWTNTELTYNGQAQKPTATATGLVGDDTCTITVTGGETNAGSYTATAESLDKDNYQLPANNTTTFSIARREVTVEAGSYKVSKVYDGNTTAGTSSGELSVSGILDADTGVSVVPTPGTYTSPNVGGQDTVAVSLVLSGDTYGNYQLTAATVDVPCTITPRPITINTASATNRDYAAGVTSVEANVTFDNAVGTLTKGSDYTVAGEMTDANAGTGKTVHVTVTLLNGNYSLAVNTTTTTVNIGKIAYTGTTTANGSAMYGNTGRVDLSNYLADGYVIGTITKTNGTIFEGDPSMDGTALTFSFANVPGNVGQTAVITVPVTSTTNYDPYSIAVTVTVEAKAVPVVTAPTAVAALTFNGEAQTLISAGSTTGGEMQYSLTSGSGYSTDLPIATNAGDYTVYYKVVGNSDYADVAENSLTVTIGKREVTATPKDVTITRGSAIPAFELIYTGLLGEDTLTPSADPTFTCFEADGTTAVSTGTAAGTYTITWTNTDIFDGETNYRVVAAPGTLTINNPSYSGGGSNTTTKTETNPDGSTTTTVTDKTTGTVTESTKNTDGSTTVVETKKDGTVTETNKSADGTTGTVVTDKNGTVTEVKSSVSSTAAKEAAKSGEAVTLPVEVPAAKNAEDAPAVDVTVPKSAGSVKVEIPVEKVTPGTVAVIVNADGTEEIVKATTMGENGVVVPLDGSATVKIVDNSKTFDDVAATDWESDAVAFVSAREIFNGTGDATFDPDVDMTRGMMVTVLARYAGANTEGGETWYDKGLEWAKENGVSDGSNPTGKLTREQMAVMLYRYAGSPDIGGQELNFPDAGNVSDFAANAMRWAVESGLINGMDGNLNPQGYATRAQLAAILMRFCQNVAQ